VTSVKPIALYLAASLTLFIGIAHSCLGERYILIRLFRRDDLPRLFGSSDFTVRTLRFAWHLTTVAWCGLAAILILLAQESATPGNLGLIVGGTFLVHGFVALVASRGKHFAWPVFLAIGVLALYATRG